MARGGGWRISGGLLVSPEDGILVMKGRLLCTMVYGFLWGAWKELMFALGYGRDIYRECFGEHGDLWNDVVKWQSVGIVVGKW